MWVCCNRIQIAWPWCAAACENWLLMVVVSGCNFMSADIIMQTGRMNTDHHFFEQAKACHVNGTCSCSCKFLAPTLLQSDLPRSMLIHDIIHKSQGLHFEDGANRCIIIVCDGQIGLKVPVRNSVLQNYQI